MAKAWTNEEITILTNQYPILGNSKELGKLLLNRTYNGIQQKAASLNLKVLNPWNKLKTTDTYADKLSNRNILIIGEYVNSNTNLLHECGICGTQWNAIPSNVIRGTGCPKCARVQTTTSLFEKNIPAKLYVLKVTLLNNIEFIKVGITRNINGNRLNAIKYEIGKDSIINIKEIIVLEDKLGYILDLEREILQNKYLTRSNLDIRFSGYTETFKTTELSNILDILLEKL